MHEGQLVFLQITDHFPLHIFRRFVERFSCLDQFLVMVFAQLTHRESLRDIESCLRKKQKALSYGYSIKNISEHPGRHE